MTLQPITWQPMMRGPGDLHGIALDRPFALACQQVEMTDELRAEAFAWVWGHTKPADWKREHVPSNILDFQNGTLLVTMVQRYRDHGKWLTIDDFSAKEKEDKFPVIYNFHHGGQLGDATLNQWLTYAFSHWVRFAHITLQKQGSPYMDII